MVIFENIGNYHRKVGAIMRELSMTKISFINLAHHLGRLTPRCQNFRFLGKLVSSAFIFTVNSWSNVEY